MNGQSINDIQKMSGKLTLNFESSLTMNEKPKEVKLTAEEAEQLKARILVADGLTEEDKTLISGLISFTIWLQIKLSKASFTLKQLKKLLGFKSEKQSKQPNDDKSDLSTPNDNVSTEDATTTDDDSSVNNTDEPPKRKKPQWNPNANHGRYGYEDYSGLKTCIHHHPTLKPGEICPQCERVEDNGKLAEFDSAIYLRLVGSPPVSGTRHKVVGLLCNLCGAMFVPEIPDSIKKAKKFSPSARSSIAIGHYEYGLPFNRVEGWQANANIPVPSSTQYDEMNKLHIELLPVAKYLRELAANSGLTYFDDTPSTLLDLIEAAGHGTAIVSQYKEHWIYLFCTNFDIASKEMDKLLKSRTSEETLILMSDASNQNALSDVEEDLVSRMVIAYCLVHGRRKFFDLLEDFPPECQIVVNCISEVYKNEAHCKAQKLTPAERLAYHQQHSATWMDALHIYLKNLWLYEQIERNSPLGAAVKYMLRNWSFLTRFLTVEGCPLDNSLCERAIKVLIRYRKNSLFYRTLAGARCGDTLMSLIHTAVRNGINAHEYLTALQEHAEHLAATPELFLPWNYEETVAQLNLAEAA